MLEIIALILAIMLLAIILRPRFYSFFFVLLLTTEFYYIEIGGGIARVYHFIAVLVVLLLARYVPLLFSSKVFFALMVFVGVNLCAIILSSTPERAIISFIAFCANVCVAIATALILLANRVNLAKLKRIIIIVTIVSVFWGLLQIVVFRSVGMVLALSPEQISQIRQGFGPAFRTEANTFAKYMVFPILLFLPEYIEYRRIKNITWVYLVFLVGILMNFTRSSIYGVGIGFVFILIWYVRRNKLFLMTSKSMKIASVVIVCIVLMLSGLLRVSEYAQYKIDNLFNQQEILEGGSSGYRLSLMRLIIDDVFSSTGKLLIGNGWAQTEYYLRGSKVRAGGGDIITILGYAGVLGVLAYLLYMFTAMNTARKIAQTSLENEISRFSEGVMFALIGIFCTSQMAGYIITPEYWLLIGVTIFLSLEHYSRGPSVTLQAEVRG